MYDRGGEIFPHFVPFCCILTLQAFGAGENIFNMKGEALKLFTNELGAITNISDQLQFEAGLGLPPIFCDCSFMSEMVTHGEYDS